MRSHKDIPFLLSRLVWPSLAPHHQPSRNEVHQDRVFSRVSRVSLGCLCLGRLVAAPGQLARRLSLIRGREPPVIVKTGIRHLASTLQMAPPFHSRSFSYRLPDTATCKNAFPSSTVHKVTMGSIQKLRIGVIGAAVQILRENHLKVVPPL